MEFMSIVGQYGTFPLLVLMIAVFILILKQERERNDNQQKQIENLSKDFKESLAKINAEISDMKRDYADKAYVQEAVGGWRTEIREVRSEIKSYNDRIDKLLMEGKK